MGDALTQLVVTPAIFYLCHRVSVAYARADCETRCGRRIADSWTNPNRIYRVQYVTPGRRFRGTAFLRTGAVSFLGGYSIWHVWRLRCSHDYHSPFRGGCPSRPRAVFGQSPADTALALQEFLLLRAAPLCLVGRSDRTERKMNTLCVSFAKTKNGHGRPGRKRSRFQTHG